MNSPTMKPKLFRPLVVLFFLAGCAGSSPVQKFAESKSAFGKNPPLSRRDIAVTQLYRVYEQGATGFVPMGAVRETAEQRARDFCGRTGKGYSVVGEQMSHPPYILGNFPRIEIVFACVDKSTSSQSSGVDDEKYTKLTHLKKLLDDGTITKEEFEEQKSKILKE
jgi:putative oligomerization/nucleic acid binding protein